MSGVLNTITHLTGMRFDANCDVRESSYAAIRLGRACDNECVYCIANQTIPQVTPSPDIDAIVSSVISLGQRDVVIEGGEPLLYLSDCKKLVNALRPHVDKIHIYTSLPSTVSHDPDTFFDIFAAVDGINFSMQHYKRGIADKIRGTITEPDHHRVTIVYSCLKRDESKVRVSLNLVKGYLDTYDDLIDNLRYFSDLGVKHIRLSELLLTPDLYVSFDKLIKGTSAARLFKSPYAFGCKTTIDLSELVPFVQKGKTELLVRRACFLVEESLQATLWDVAKELIQATRVKKQTRDGLYNFRVILEDGTVDVGWNLPPD